MLSAAGNEKNQSEGRPRERARPWTRPKLMSKQAEESCPCLEGETYFQNFESRALGMDSDYGEVSVDKCKRCGRYWLHYLMEYEYLSRSGRWFRSVVTPEVAASVKADDAKRIIESLDYYFRGGSAFGGKTIKTSGSLEIWLVPFSGPE
jgi:hypothetical protein